MSETPVDVWSEVRRLRCDVADRIEALSPEQWEAQSWCAGWRVRDVLGHLVHLAEASQLSMVRAVLRAGARPDRALDRAARRVGAEPVPELAQRLRDAADGRYHVLGTPPAVALGEVLVHSGDALRPLGLTTDAPPADVALVLDFYVRFGRLAFHTPQPRSTCLVATVSTGGGVRAQRSGVRP